MPVCGLHRTYLLGVITEAATKEARDRFLGFGYAIEEVKLDGFAALRCDKSTTDRPHSWTGQVGGSCHWCLSSFIAMMKDHRDTVLQSPDMNSQDHRYEHECRRKIQSLKNAIKIGLITSDEALARFDKWVANA